MARHYKRWEDHSQRWQRENSRKGLDKKRWNAWLKLSEKTRKQTDPVKYSSGLGVSGQRRERKEQEAFRKIKTLSPSTSRLSTIRRNVGRMTDSDLDWTLKASPSAIRNKSAKKSMQGYPSNPWWYR